MANGKNSEAPEPVTLTGQQRSILALWLKRIEANGDLQEEIVTMTGGTRRPADAERVKLLITAFNAIDEGTRNPDDYVEETDA